MPNLLAPSGSVVTAIQYDHRAEKKRKASQFQIVSQPNSVSTEVAALLSFMQIPSRLRHPQFCIAIHPISYEPNKFQTPWAVKRTPLLPELSPQKFTSVYGQIRLFSITSTNILVRGTSSIGKTHPAWNFGPTASVKIVLGTRRAG
jgi:hypothetical protein